MIEEDLGGWCRNHGGNTSKVQEICMQGSCCRLSGGARGASWESDGRWPMLNSVYDSRPWENLLAVFGVSGGRTRHLAPV